MLVLALAPPPPVAPLWVPADEEPVPPDAVSPPELQGPLLMVLQAMVAQAPDLEDILYEASQKWSAWHTYGWLPPYQLHKNCFMSR